MFIASVVTELPSSFRSGMFPVSLLTELQEHRITFRAINISSLKGLSDVVKFDSMLGQAPKLRARNSELETRNSKLDGHGC